MVFVDAGFYLEINWLVEGSGGGARRIERRHAWRLYPWCHDLVQEIHVNAGGVGRLGIGIEIL